MLLNTLPVVVPRKSIVSSISSKTCMILCETLIQGFVSQVPQEIELRLEPTVIEFIDRLQFRLRCLKHCKKLCSNSTQSLFPCLENVVLDGGTSMGVSKGVCNERNISGSSRGLSPVTAFFVFLTTCLNTTVVFDPLLTT